MGFTTRELLRKGQTESWFRKRLGLGVRVPNNVVALTAAMAHDWAACLGRRVPAAVHFADGVVQVGAG